MTETPSRCAHCGAVVSPGVRFCPECGRSTAPRAASPLPWILGGLAGLILIILLISLLRPKAPPVTEALPTAPVGPPVVAAPSRALPAGPPVVGPPSRPQGPVDPNQAAVAAYLKQMEAIEKRRKDLINNLYPAMLTLAMLKSLGGMKDLLQMLDEDVEQAQKQAPPSSTQQQAEGTIEGYRSGLRSLAMDVQRIRPPIPAQRFHNGYLFSLGTYEAVINEIETAMQAGDQSIASQGGSLKGRVDQAMKADDDELGRLLDRYHLSRTFSVSDEMSGTLTGAPVTP